VLDEKTLQALPEIPSPVLTAYLDTNPARRGNRGLQPAYAIWLKSEIKKLARAVPAGDQKLFHAQANRALETLETSRGLGKGLLLFSGAKTRRVFPLPVEVENELSWGAPALAQLLWLLDEHRPWGIVLVGLKGARFFLQRLGRLDAVKEEAAGIKIANWRKKHLISGAYPWAKRSGGTQRDFHERRLSVQYRHFFRHLAEEIRQWSRAGRLKSLLLVGPGEMLAEIRSNFPAEFAERVAGLEEDLGWMPASELEKRLAPEIERQEREREKRLVARLLSDDPGKVLGIERTLAQIQRGRARLVVVTRGLDERLKRCTGCGFASRTGGAACPACAGRRVSVSLRATLGELARQGGAAIEVVGGEPAKRLGAAGGIGAWLKSKTAAA
jgi:Bacterial archaeo-eukaryotic release factor family 10